MTSLLHTIGTNMKTKYRECDSLIIKDSLMNAFLLEGKIIFPFIIRIRITLPIIEQSVNFQPQLSCRNYFAGESIIMWTTPVIFYLLEGKLPVP